MEEYGNCGKDTGCLDEVRAEGADAYRILKKS
jgi:hypothetical protein